MYVNNQSISMDMTLSEVKKTAAEPSGNSTFADYMKTLQSQSAVKGNGVDDSAQATVFPMNTNNGNLDINLEDYFNGKPATGEPVNLLDVPLLLPTAHNIDTLAKYSEQKVKSLMEQYGIPTPPATIEFDQEGRLVLPQDYPHAEQLRQALEENEHVEKALRTTSALASHYAGMMEGQPYRDEMSTARSQADRDRIIEKYSYLFDDNRPPINIVLSFLDDGSMLVGGRTAATEGNTMFKVTSTKEST